MRDDVLTLVRRHAALSIALVTTLLALYVRYDFAVVEHPPDLYLMHDMAFYAEQGESLLSRPRQPWDTYTPIGFPLFLAAIGGVPNLAAFHVLLGALTAGLTAWLAWRVTGSRLASAIAGVGCALYAPLVFYSGFALTETVCAFLTMAGIVAVFEGLRREQRGWTSVGGAWLGLAVLTRPALLPFVALLVVQAAVSWRAGRRELGFAVLGISLVLAPAAFHTSRLLGRPAVVSSNGGVNFFLAHANCRAVHSTAPNSRINGVSTHYSRTHLSGTCETDRPLIDEPHFYAMGLAELRAHPGRLIRAFDALGEGVGLAPARAYPDQPFWPGSMEHEDTLNNFSRAYFWVLLLPALLHAAHRVRRRKRDAQRERRILWLLLGSVVFVLYGFNGNPRVRVSSDPVAIVLAAGAFAAAINAIRRRVAGASS